MLSVSIPRDRLARPDLGEHIRQGRIGFKRYFAVLTTTAAATAFSRGVCREERPEADGHRYCRPAPILMPPGPNVLSVGNQNRFFFSAAMLCA